MHIAIGKAREEVTVELAALVECIELRKVIDTEGGATDHSNERSDENSKESQASKIKKARESDHSNISSIDELGRPSPSKEPATGQLSPNLSSINPSNDSGSTVSISSKKQWRQKFERVLGWISTLFGR